MPEEFRLVLLSNIVYSACQWACVVALAKLGHPTDVGAYALGVAITSPILMLANFQGRNLIASDVRNEYSFGEHLSFRLVCFALAMSSIAAVLAIKRDSHGLGWIILTVGVAQCFDYISETVFGLLQRHDRLDRVAFSLILKGPLSLVSLAVTMKVTHNVLWAVIGLAGGRFLVLMIVDIRNAFLVAGPYKLVWNLRTHRSLFITAFPLGLISALGVFNINIPRYFIETYLGKHDLGLFSALASLIGAGNLVIAALASCSVVGLAKAWVACDTPKYRALSLQLVAVSLLLGGLGVFVALIAGHTILGVLFSPDYAKNTGAFARMMIAGAFGYLVSAQGYAMTAARKLVQQIPMLASAAVITAVASWYLIPARGLEGAAEAWVAGSAMLLACNAIFMGRMLRSNGLARASLLMNQA